MKQLFLTGIILSIGIFVYIVSSEVFKKTAVFSFQKKIKASPSVLKVICFGCVFLFVMILSSKIIVSVMSMLVCYTVYDFIKQIYKRKNSIAVENELVEVLGNVSSSVSAGQSLLQGLEYSSKTIDGKVSDLLKDALVRVNLGESLKEVLIQVPEKLDSKEAKIAFDSMIISQETGANLSEMLRKVVRTLKDRLTAKKRIGTLTVQGRMSGAIVGLVPFILLMILYILEPSMVTGMFNTTLGNFMLLTIVVMDLIGMTLIKKIVYLET